MAETLNGSFANPLLARRSAIKDQGILPNTRIVTLAIFTFFVIAILCVLCCHTHAETFSSPRSGKAILTVYDQTGNPVPNATILYQQTSHDFLFGVGMTGPEGILPYKLYPQFHDMGVNFLMPLALWNSTEPEPGLFTWQMMDAYRLPELTQLGYVVDGQLLIFFFDQNWCIPAYLKTMTYDQILPAVYNHVYTLVSHYAGLIKYWDINEPGDPRSSYFNFTTEQWVEIVRTSVQAIRNADPDAKILVNLVVDDHDGWTPQGFLDALFAGNVNFDAIGLEIYVGMVPSDVNGYPSIIACSEKIHTFDRFNKPILITEIAVPAIPSQQTQADWLKAFYSMAFQVPSVKGISYFYVVDDSGSTMGLYPDANSPPRLIYYALGDFIKAMTSTGSVVTGSTGDALIEGIAGDYLLTVSAGNKISEHTIHINAGETMTTSVFLSPPTNAVLSVSPTSLSCKCLRGQNAASQTFTVQNIGIGTLGYSISKNSTWLSVAPTSGTSTGERDTITVNYATRTLASGKYYATITISAPGATGTPKTIGVTLEVPPPSLAPMLILLRD